MRGSFGGGWPREPAGVLIVDPATHREVAEGGEGVGEVLGGMQGAVLRHTRRTHARAALTAGCDLYQMVTLSSGSSHNASPGDTLNVE